MSQPLERHVLFEWPQMTVYNEETMSCHVRKEWTFFHLLNVEYRLKDLTQKNNCVTNRALQNWKIFVKALSKQLWKFDDYNKTIITIIWLIFPNIISKNGEF